MARTYKRDSKGRFSGTPGGGTSRSTEQGANNRRKIRAGEVYNQSGPARRNRSAAKQVRGQKTAVEATRVYQKRDAVLNSAAGARLGGKRQVIRQNQSLKIGNRVGDAYNRRIGAKYDTPETNKVAVKAMVAYNRRKRISQAAAKSGLGRRRRRTR